MIFSTCSVGGEGGVMTLLMLMRSGHHTGCFLNVMHFQRNLSSLKRFALLIIFYENPQKIKEKSANSFKA